MSRVLLATGADMPELSSDDAILHRALRDANIDASPAVWSDPTVEWSEADLVVIRSTWDYVPQFDRYLEWVRHVARVSTLLNPPDLVEWNLHKSYLRDLSGRGVPIVPTVWVHPGADVELRLLMMERGWGRVVLKPAVGATGIGLIDVTESASEKGNLHLRELLQNGSALVQEFLAGVESEGEISFVFVDGQFVHSVRKLPASGDFRVHEEHGGSTEPYQPDHADVELSRRCLSVVDHDLLYGRVDLIHGHGRSFVSELEVAEPELYFRFSDDAVGAMVGGIERRLSAQQSSR